MNNEIPNDDRCRVVSIFDAKTREVPRPTPPALPRPWRQVDQETYVLPHTNGVAAVTFRAAGRLEIDSLDDGPTLLRLVDLLGWLARQARVGDDTRVGVDASSAEPPYPTGGAA